jgi:aspartate aminotransferase-like enzyme
MYKDWPYTAPVKLTAKIGNIADRLAAKGAAKMSKKYQQHSRRLCQLQQVRARLCSNRTK